MKDTRQQVRQAAAEWLGRFQLDAAIPALQAALKKEKGEAVKATMLNALRRLGVSLHEMVDRDGLAQEAREGLKKGLPPALAWFPFDMLPAVHWADSGEQVDPRIITWWLAVTTKVGSPEPTALLQCYGELLAPGEREGLARFILEAWISYDTLRKYTQEEAAVLARQQTEQSKQWRQQHPEYAGDGWTEEHAYQYHLRAVMHECKGSAVKEKGLLAVVAACGGADIPAVVQDYLKYWYGHRPHPCKALVRMLSWIDRGSAVQQLLLVAMRFRTKSIQQEADCPCMSWQSGKAGRSMSWPTAPFPPPGLMTGRS